MKKKSHVAAMRPARQTISKIVAKTLRKYQPQLIANITQNNALLRFMRGS